jgi:hypothetical protein
MHYLPIAMRSMEEATLIYGVDDQMGAVVSNIVFLFVLIAILRVFRSVAGVGSFGLSMGDHVKYEIVWI